MLLAINSFDWNQNQHKLFCGTEYYEYFQEMARSNPYNCATKPCFWSPTNHSYTHCNTVLHQDNRVNIVAKFQVPSSYGLGETMFWKYFHKGWLSHWTKNLFVEQPWLHRVFTAHTLYYTVISLTYLFWQRMKFMPDKFIHWVCIYIRMMQCWSPAVFSRLLEDENWRLFS